MSHDGRRRWPRNSPNPETAQPPPFVTDVGDEGDIVGETAAGRLVLGQGGLNPDRETTKRGGGDLRRVIKVLVFSTDNLSWSHSTSNLVFEPLSKNHQWLLIVSAPHEPT